MSVKLLAKLPPDENDGLAALAAVMDENPLQTFTVVCTIVAASRTADFDHPDNPVVYRFRISAIEPLSDQRAADDAKALLDEAFERRTGMKRLDFGADGDE